MLHIDVSGSVQVTLEVASIEADGSFEYLTEKMVRNIKQLNLNSIGSSPDPCSKVGGGRHSRL